MIPQQCAPDCKPIFGLQLFPLSPRSAPRRQGGWVITCMRCSLHTGWQRKPSEGMFWKEGNEEQEEDTQVRGNGLFLEDS